MSMEDTSAIFDITCASPATLQGNTDLAFYDTMIAALTNWGPLGCKESFKHTAKFLRSWGVILNENGSDLCSIMNGTVKHNMRIKSEQHPESVSPKGFLLLYCLAEHFNCTVFLFSTRKKPTIIKPMQGDRATRNFAALLCHQDSFMQKTTWFSLKRQDGFIRNSSALKAPSSLANANNDIVATKFVKDSKKARHETIYSNEKSDQQVMKHLQEEVFSVYRKRWCEFLQKKQSSKSVDDFRKTLSTKSLPNKVVSKVQVQMEQQLGNIQPGWVQAVIQRLRTAKTMPTAAQYVALFIKDLKKELETAQNGEPSTSGTSASGTSASGAITAGASKAGASASSGTSASGASTAGSSTAGSSTAGSSTAGASTAGASASSGASTGPEDGAGGAGTGGSGSDQVIRSVSRSLKAVLHPSFDSKVFFEVIKNFQASCHLCIRGLSKAIGVLIDFVLRGQLGGKTKATFFNVEDVDLFNCGLGKKAKPISFINDTDAGALQGLFDYSGFWKTLSFCIGRKNEDKTKIPLLVRIQEKLDRTDYVDFTTRSALQEACRMYYTNFSNIYSQKNCQAVLRTVLTLLLKINLCRERLFGDKKTRTYKRKQKKGPKPQSQQATKKLAMDKLFWLLGSDCQVDQCIDKQMRIIFSVNKKKPNSKQLAAPSTPITPSSVSSKGKSPMQATSSSCSLSTANDDPNIELVDNDDSDLESVIDDDIQDEEEYRDLTAKEINALTSVSMMLCQSTTIQGNVSAQYVKQQLYTDKRDSIPAIAIDHCCAIINAIKSLVPKEDYPPSYKWFGLFELHNTLVTFHQGITRKNPRALFPTVDNPHNSQDRMAIALDAATLYSLFCKDYRIYQKDKSEFTSTGMIKTTQAKEDLFSNFFNMPKIHKILREQKLTFCHYIKFKDLYNVHLVGVKTLGSSSSSGIKSTIDKPDPKPHVPKSSRSSSKADVIKANTLSSTLKETKKKLRPLKLQLSKLQRSRMDAGHASRSWEKTNKALDWDLYSKLKEARKKHDTLWATVSSMKAQIKQMSSDLYILNKRIHGQQEPQAADAQTPQLTIDENTVIQGTDPGVVTTASSVWCSSRTLFASINRYQVLWDDHDTKPPPADQKQIVKSELTAKKIDTAVLSPRRQKRTRSSGKTLQKARATRRIRLKKCHQHFVAAEAKSADIFSTGQKPRRMVPFIGNWHRNATHLRGHCTRSMKPYLSNLSTTSTVAFVDEFNSTKICWACFHETQKQLMRNQEGHMTRNLGAVTCYNTKCPMRASKQTTSNRDAQGAINIALIGFSKLVSKDGSVLPPFARKTNHDK
ncbi:hypothetical protein FB192DRAFT_1142283 [Mucor lusitanicus]|uniref:Uncharacterized protein n=1 Tax=Mucor circinelloides f. lusitanicus TaxID=29924 RepID=A0A8H4BDC8_MUCCL|nr:hypothetical protein FB192DRAFT_1142283 [Mucor lusitanicus]